MKKLPKIKLPQKFLIPLVAVVVIATATGGYVGYQRYTHRHDIHPNTGVPTTGMSIVFNPSLKHTATVKIDGSDDKLVRSVTLAKADPKDSANLVSDPLGTRYNIALKEGVYRIRVTSSRHDFPPYIATVTVTDHRLTTQNVNFAGIAR